MGNWRLIDSAPKDGSYLLMSDGANIWRGRWVEECRDEELGILAEAGWETDGEGFACFPSHWMPLPDLPT